MNQVKNSFDLVSLKKLGYDILIVFGPQIVLYALKVLQTIDFGRFTEVIGFALAGLILVVKRYMQGTPATITSVNPQDINNTL